MSRLLFGPGARGPSVEAIQSALGFAHPDGIYGRKTTAFIASFQRQAGLARNGLTDDALWERLLRRPIPSLFERSLALTAAFEGHGFGLAQGNFDGAGLTWGIIGFTLRSGSLGKLLRTIKELDPTAIPGAFGDRHGELVRLLAAPLKRQMEWADSVSADGSLVDPWKSAFGRLGEHAVARQAQIDLARAMYYEPAKLTAGRLGFDDELGRALCFDIQVQNGGPKPQVAIKVAAAGGPAIERRELLARLTAQAALSRWQGDVLARKMAIARGSGRVHGRTYQLANWGLGEYPAN